ncbi:protein of unknown function [Pseudomonas sp. JV551A1]|nr:protein of unknown function [Pseudomonas sp. JV551A1]
MAHGFPPNFDLGDTLSSLAKDSIDLGRQYQRGGIVMAASWVFYFSGPRWAFIEFKLIRR